MLRFIQRPETDPYYNLAAEEYFLKTAEVDIFMTWRNEPSVIIGKHQNALKEINSSFIQKHNLPVIRRITGGGTVYHDPGNINFSFIFINRKENLIDFKEFTKPVILFLQSLGLEAVFDGKNNISIKGLKVSGNSAHLHKHKVLYHGTLLFNTNLDFLNEAISGKEMLYQDKAVKSIHASVVNINELLKDRLSIDEFMLHFQDFIFNYFGGKIDYDLDKIDLAEIRKLAEEKYRSYEWNYGYSPEYEFNNEWVYEDEAFFLSLKVQDGMIRELKLDGPEKYSFLLKIVEEKLIGKNHDKDTVMNILAEFKSDNNISMPALNQIAEHLF
jgi:lipoate---protein ligase